MDRTKELLLLSYFRRNARETLTKISRKTKIPVSTIFDKLKKYEGDIINKHTCLINFKKLGFNLKVNILFKLKKDNREEFQEFLKKHQKVNSVFRINNGFDYLVEGIFRDIKELQDFGDETEKFDIADRKDFFILDDIKREDFLSKEIHLGLIDLN